MNAETLAWMNFGGMVLIMVGTVFWAYEILGGRGGPLGLLMRAVTYTLIASTVYGLFLGLVFGGVAGIGLGLILALEYHRVARHQRLYGSSPLNNLPYTGAARGIVIGLASIYSFNWRFAIVFGGFSALGLFIVYYFRFSPTFDYRSHHRPTMSKHRFMASFWRGVAIGISAFLATWIVPEYRWASESFGLYMGGVVMIGSITSSLVSPMVEWWIDNLPERRVAASGVAIVLVGTMMECVQPVLTVLRIPVH